MAMAFTRLSLPFPLLILFSLLVIAFAGDYGNDSSEYGYGGDHGKDSFESGYNGSHSDNSLVKRHFDLNPKGEEKYNYGENSEVYKPKSEEEKTDEFGSKPEEEKKPNYEEKPDVYKPKIEGEKKLEYGSMPEEEKPNYGEKSDVYKPKSEDEKKLEYGSKAGGEEKSNYDKKPDVYKPNPEEEKKPENGSKPEGEEKSSYGGKPDVYKLHPEEEKKPEYGSKPEGGDDDDDDDNDDDDEDEKEKPNYTPKPDFNQPKPEKKQNLEYAPKPKQEEEKPYYGEETEKLGVEGLVLCKSGFKYYPIQGATTKVTCQVVDLQGLEKTLPICSVSTDAKGYFYATVSSLSLVDKSLKLKDCKVFLERSPLEFCNVPTDVNKGITGAPLSGTYRYLNEHHIKLYSVGTFFYTSEPHAVPNNGY